MDDNLVNGLISAGRGVVQGVFYGTKIRLPHALVMTLLFGEGSLRDKARSIAWLAFQHARALAAFVGVYKGTLVLLRLADGPDDPCGRPSFGVAARPLHALAAGALGGYVVWARYSSVNYQIVLYLFSRVAVALVRLAASRGLLGQRLGDVGFDEAYPWLATVVWSLVLWLYEFHPALLHPSLEASMRTLYADSNSWSSISDFMPTPAAAAVAAYLVTSLYWEGKSLAPLFDLSATRLW